MALFFSPVERLNPLCVLFTAMTDTSKLCKCACMCPRVFVNQNHKNVWWRLYAGLSVEFIWWFSAGCMWNISRPGAGRNWIQCELKFNNVFQFRMLLLQCPIIYFQFLFNPCAVAAKMSNVFFYVSQMDDIDAMFSHLLGEIDDLSQVGCDLSDT